jgi:hypothetical protein
MTAFTYAIADAIVPEKEYLFRWTVWWGVGLVQKA